MSLAATAAAGVAAAGQQSVRPQVEGREPDPVILRFHAAEPPTFGYGAGPGVPPAAFRFEFPWPAVDFLCDLFPNQFTMPLGTVPVGD
jgi:hypothetical protein